MIVYIDLPKNLKKKFEQAFEYSGWFISTPEEANLIVAKKPHPYKPSVVVGKCRLNPPDNVIDIIPEDIDQIALELRLRLYAVYLQTGDFESILEEEFMKSRRYTLPLSVVIFKVMENDPKSIRKILSVVNLHSRRSDKSFRISEDEIMAILPGTDREGAEIFVKRVTRRYTKEYIKENVLKKPDFVFGIGSLEEWMISAEDLLSSAEFDLLRKIR